MPEQTPTPDGANGSTPPPAADAPNKKKAEKRYRIVPSGAGGFNRDELVTESQINKTGGTLKDWLEIGSVVPEGEPDPVKEIKIPRPPRPASATSVEGLPK